MYARVVRFTDVNQGGIDNVVSRVKESDGPPPGVDSTAIKLLYDESQGTAVALMFFEDEEKMRAADEIFEQMDSSETPGTRASVDRCEIKIERDA